MFTLYYKFSCENVTILQLRGYYIIIVISLHTRGQQSQSSNKLQQVLI